MKLHMAYFDLISKITSFFDFIKRIAIVSFLSFFFLDDCFLQLKPNFF